MLTALLVGLGAGNAGAQQWRPRALDLGEPLFVYNHVERDRDGDGLKDDLERVLAEEFKPKLIFDSSEHHRLPHEPVTLFQVRPSGCIGLGCPGPRVNTVVLKYAFLFQEDGGYGPSSDCRDAHNGDNQSADFTLQSRDDRVWKLVHINNGGKFEWSQPLGGEANDGRHVNIYMSAHKHHQYFGTGYDHKDSPYSSWGCNDDVNGRGVQILPELYGEVCHNVGISGGVRRVACQNMPHNVGEPEAHSPAFFVSELDSFGYKGENAWSGKAFKGGLGDDGGTTSSLLSMWLTHSFRFGSEFAVYLAVEKQLTPLQLPLLVHASLGGLLNAVQLPLFTH